VEVDQVFVVVVLQGLRQGLGEFRYRFLADTVSVSFVQVNIFLFQRQNEKLIVAGVKRHQWLEMVIPRRQSEILDRVGELVVTEVSRGK
jgi:hypothetical protein